MAIVVKEKEVGVSLYLILITVFILCFLGISSYYLFRSENPLIEEIGPFKTSNIDLPQDNLDPSKIVESEIFNTLREVSTIQLPNTGKFGRINPFLKF